MKFEKNRPKFLFHDYVFAKISSSPISLVDLHTSDTYVTIDDNI